MSYSRPTSVLVVIHTDDGRVLLMRRAKPFDFWQSVTGCLEDGETHFDAAPRELFEETGLTDEGELLFSGVDRYYKIDPRWIHRFPPGTVENREYEWRYRVPKPVEVTLSGAEHSEFVWVPIDDAIEMVWSWTNREALEALKKIL
jgi:dATP pyrophosphohydrolase